jgi:O-antigen/teichoic acid export membrane protein
LVANSGYQMATQATNGLLGYVFWIIAARLSSASAVGLATALLSVMTLVASVANLGLSFALMQNLPRLRGDHEWSTTVTTGLGGAGLAGVIAGALAVVGLGTLLGRFSALIHDPGLIAIFVVGGSLTTVVSVADAVFSGARSSAQMLIRNLAWNAAKIMLLAAPLVAGARLTNTGIVASWVIGLAVSTLGVFAVQLGRLGHRYRASLRGARRAVGVLRSSLGAHYLTQLGANLPQFLLPVIVVVRLSSTQNAYFYVAWSVGGAFFLISPSVANALFAEGVHRPREMADTVKRAALIISALLAPAMIALGLGGRYVIGLFGAAYAAHSELLLLLLVVSAVPDAVTNVYLVVLRLRGRLRTAAALNIGMALAALAGAWFLLPRVGVSGAGWAWLGAQTAGAVIVLAAVAIARGGRAMRCRGDHFRDGAGRSRTHLHLTEEPR